MNRSTHFLNYSKTQKSNKWISCDTLSTFGVGSSSCSSSSSSSSSSESSLAAAAFDRPPRLDITEGICVRYDYPYMNKVYQKMQKYDDTPPSPIKTQSYSLVQLQEEDLLAHSVAKYHPPGAKMLIRCIFGR